MLLKPKEGWPYVRSILRDPDKEFRLGHAALKTVRFLWNNRSDLFSHKELAEALAPLLEMNDTADLVIEDFRKWQYWHMTEKILALQEHPVYTGKLVQRTMLRYALSVKNKPAAQQFVNAWRVKDAELVADIEELLAMDDKPTK
jgi:hypothetical protein